MLTCLTLRSAVSFFPDEFMLSFDVYNLPALEPHVHDRNVE